MFPKNIRGAFETIAMADQDIAYFMRRAVQEQRLASLAQHPSAAASHRMLAALYLERCRALMPAPMIVEQPPIRIQPRLRQAAL